LSSCTIGGFSRRAQLHKLVNNNDNNDDDDDNNNNNNNNKDYYGDCKSRVLAELS
jgi:hypothetical protein